jgi:hypothetical protein
VLRGGWPGSRPRREEIRAYTNTRGVIVPQDDYDEEHAEGERDLVIFGHCHCLVAFIFIPEVDDDDNEDAATRTP